MTNQEANSWQKFREFVSKGSSTDKIPDDVIAAIEEIASCIDQKFGNDLKNKKESKKKTLANILESGTIASKRACDFVEAMKLKIDKLTTYEFVYGLACSSERKKYIKFKIEDVRRLYDVYIDILFTNSSLIDEINASISSNRLSSCSLDAEIEYLVEIMDTMYFVSGEIYKCFKWAVDRARGATLSSEKIKNILLKRIPPGCTKDEESKFKGLVGQFITTDLREIFVSAYENAAKLSEKLNQRFKGLIDVTEELIDAIIISNISAMDKILAKGKVKVFYDSVFNETMNEEERAIRLAFYHNFILKLSKNIENGCLTNNKVNYTYVKTGVRYHVFSPETKAYIDDTFLSLMHKNPLSKGDIEHGAEELDSGEGISVGKDERDPSPEEKQIKALEENQIEKLASSLKEEILSCKEKGVELAEKILSAINTDFSNLRKGYQIRLFKDKSDKGGIKHINFEQLGPIIGVSRHKAENRTRKLFAYINKRIRKHFRDNEIRRDNVIVKKIIIKLIEKY